jgi:hypothetical protein
MTRVRCPDCDEAVRLPAGTQAGALVACPSCAGQALRVNRRDGRWSATLAHRVSCPACEAAVWLPEAARPGDTLTHCGARYRLTWEFGAFAAEPERADNR